MTSEQIQARAKRETVKHETALKIRELLDAAFQEANPDDEAEFEGEILELVTEAE